MFAFLNIVCLYDKVAFIWNLIAICITITYGGGNMIIHSLLWWAAFTLSWFHLRMFKDQRELFKLIDFCSFGTSHHGYAINYASVFYPKRCSCREAAAAVFLIVITFWSAILIKFKLDLTSIWLRSLLKGGFRTNWVFTLLHAKAHLHRLGARVCR